MYSDLWLPRPYGGFGECYVDATAHHGLSTRSSDQISSGVLAWRGVTRPSREHRRDRREPYGKSTGLILPAAITPQCLRWTIESTQRSPLRAGFLFTIGDCSSFAWLSLPSRSSIRDGPE